MEEKRESKASMSDYTHGLTHGRGSVMLLVGIWALLGWAPERWQAWFLVGFGAFLQLWPWPWKRGEG